MHRLIERLENLRRFFGPFESFRKFLPSFRTSLENFCQKSVKSALLLVPSIKLYDITKKLASQCINNKYGHKKTKSTADRTVLAAPPYENRPINSVPGETNIDKLLHRETRKIKKIIRADQTNPDLLGTGPRNHKTKQGQTKFRVSKTNSWRGELHVQFCQTNIRKKKIEGKKKRKKGKKFLGRDQIFRTKLSRLSDFGNWIESSSTLLGA